MKVRGQESTGVRRVKSNYLWKFDNGRIQIS